MSIGRTNMNVDLHDKFKTALETATSIDVYDKFPNAKHLTGDYIVVLRGVEKGYENDTFGLGTTGNRPVTYIVEIYSKKLSNIYTTIDTIENYFVSNKFEDLKLDAIDQSDSDSLTIGNQVYHLKMLSFSYQFR